MKKFLKKFKSILAVGLITVLLSTSAQGSGVYGDSSGQTDETADGGAYAYCVATGEVTYIPPVGIESYSDETERYSPGYDPFADGENTYEISLLGYRDRYKIEDPANNSSCRNTVYIEATTQSGAKISGSGFMIGPNAVATCGHLLCNDKYGEDRESWAWIKSAKVTPAMNTGKNPEPYGTANATNFICGRDWAKSYEEYDDWGIIVLDSNIGNKVGWLGLRCQSKSYNGTSIMVNGYPDAYGSTKNLYKSYGAITETKSKLLYSRSTLVSDGNSGGPCYIDSDDTGYTAIGITIGYYNDNTDQYYEAAFRRITCALYDRLVEYRTSTL